MSKPTGSGYLYLPNSLLRDQTAQAIEEGIKPVCPAATKTRFKDTGRPAIHCGIERNAFAVEDAPMAALRFCCYEYAQCPTWRAAKEGDPIIERVRKAEDKAARDAVTKRQIETGMRVDDKGLDPDTHPFERALIQEIEKEREK